MLTSSEHSLLDSDASPHLAISPTEHEKSDAPEEGAKPDPLELPEEVVERFGMSSFYYSSRRFLRLLPTLVDQPDFDFMKGLKVLDLAGGGGSITMLDPQTEEVLLDRYPPYFAMLCGLNGAEAYSLDLPGELPEVSEEKLYQPSFSVAETEEWPHLAGFIPGNILDLLDAQNPSLSAANGEATYGLITCRNLIGDNHDPLLKVLIENSQSSYSGSDRVMKSLRGKMLSAVTSQLKVGGFFIADWIEGEEGLENYTCWRLEPDGTLKVVATFPPSQA